MQIYRWASFGGRTCRTRTNAFDGRVCYSNHFVYLFVWPIKPSFGEGFVLQTTIDERIWPGIVNGLCYWWNTSIRPWCRNEAPMHRRQQSLSPNQYHRQSFALSNPFTSLCCLPTGHLPDKQCSQLDSFFFIFWLQCAVILLAESLSNTGWLSVATDSSSANQSFAHHLSVCLVEFQRQRTP